MNLKLKHLMYLLILLAGIIFILISYLFITWVLSKYYYERDSLLRNSPLSMETCNKISTFSYDTGLIFNPENKQTFYLKSECYLKVAVEERDSTICNKVIERKSIFFNGTGISKNSCILEVQALQQNDNDEKVGVDDIHIIKNVFINHKNRHTILELEIITEGAPKGRYDLSFNLYDNQDGGLGPINTPTGNSTLNFSVAESETSIQTLLYIDDIKRLSGRNNIQGEKFILEIKLKPSDEFLKDIKINGQTKKNLESSLKKEFQIN